MHLIVLDEATAFSDPENEHSSKTGASMKGKTVIMIAHRLSQYKVLIKLVIDNELIEQEIMALKNKTENMLYGVSIKKPQAEIARKDCLTKKLQVQNLFMLSDKAYKDLKKQY